MNKEEFDLLEDYYNLISNDELLSMIQDLSIYQDYLDMVIDNTKGEEKQKYIAEYVKAQKLYEKLQDKNLKRKRELK